ncbi:MAG: NAD(P)-binding domain-containing protein [Bacteroidetes bacterium]|jgi:pyrroline-5-carboxylate reductase|nr:NAD(P)-binding domain-containing protein [Bacteroidota bacterium]MBT7144278.1 NAD(P)-binding domain-containing protein [Bacteroidota bacterium]MBT7492932.1 NAD(P)-binding domain-containing protein [Bacteroidota bacterium]
MKSKSIGFIGGGRITKILLQGFKNQNVKFNSVMVCDINDKTLIELKKNFPFIETTTSAQETASKEVVFIALHPHVIGEIVFELKDAIDSNTLIISLAPKFSIQKLSELLGTQRIIRVIPNATSFANLGYNPICFANAIGKSEKESVLEAYAIASAMLPTYFWFQWKEIEHISKEMGFAENESKEAVYETLKAALELMYNRDLSYSGLIDLIPVKPIGENEDEIKGILKNKLLGLFDKIKP